MENKNPGDLKLRRALTDIGTFSTEDENYRRRQFPRLFKQTTFVSTLFPNFNKSFRFTNSWTPPEISRADRIVVEHLKTRTHFRYRMNEFFPTERICGKDLQNQVNKTPIENASNETNKRSAKRQLTLPKLEKDFHLANHNSKEQILRLLYKRSTNTGSEMTSSIDNNEPHCRNAIRNAGLIAYYLNKNVHLGDFHLDSKSVDNPAIRCFPPADNGGGLPKICMADQLSKGFTETQNAQEKNYEDQCWFSASNLDYKNTSSSKSEDVNQNQGNKTISSSGNNSDKTVNIDMKNHLNSDLSCRPLENDHVQQNGIRRILSEKTAKVSPVYNSESPAIRSKSRETVPTDDSEITTLLKHDLRILPVYRVPICRNDVTTTNIKRNVYNGDIAYPVSTNNKLFRICLWADRDMSEECRAFQDNLFPRLKYLGQQAGIEIELIDLHINQSDPSCQDSFRLELFTKVLRKFLESEGQSRLVVLLGEKYGHPILPSVIPSREFKSLQEQLIQQPDSPTKDDQRLSVIDDFRSSSRCSARSRANSVSNNHLLQQSFNYTDRLLKPITRVGTSMNKSPPEPTVLVSNVSDERGSHMVSGSDIERTHTSDGQSILLDLYWADDQEGQDVYRLKSLKFSESESKKWKEKISTILQFLPKLMLKPEKEKYQQSLLHAVLSSISNSSKTTAADDHIVCAVRNVTNGADSLQPWVVHQYFDTNADKNEINREMCQRMKELRGNFVSSKVSPGNLVALQLDLQEDAARSVRERQFSFYAKRIQDELYERLATEITNNVQNKSEDAVLQEVLQHVAFCQQRVRDSCLIQKEILRAIMAYATSTKPRAFVLYGPDGSGKTTLMSLAAVHLKVWTESFHSNTHVLVRMIGCTRDSLNICDLLYGLCIQLQDIFHISAPVPTDYTGLINLFSHLLSCACVNDKLVIFVDGLDLLEGSPEITLQWIPKELHHVRLIVSTRPQEKQDYLRSLRKMLDQSSTFKEIFPLEYSEDVEALTSVLEKRHKRTISREAKAAIISQFRKTLFPLNVVLFVMESFSSENSLNTTDKPGCDPSIKQMIVHKFNHLEQQFSRTFVQRALGYLTSAKFGLSFNELESALAIDEALMTPDHSQLSPYQLLSFLFELQPYLRESDDGNCRVIRWGHQIFHAAAEERYLNKEVQTFLYHKNLAKIFINDPPVFGQNKPKMSPSEHLIFYNCGESLSKTHFNYRKLKELPYHLVRSQQADVLMKGIIFSFEWMQAELCATSFGSVLRLLEEAKSMEVQNNELDLLIRCLRLSEPVLKRSPDQLASQLIGRFSFLSSSMIKTSSGEAPKYPNLTRLIDSTRRSPFPTLLPADTCLVKPDDDLPIHLYGHIAPINAIDLTADGEFLLTASKDDTVKMWDMRNGRVIRSISEVGASVFALIWARNDTCAITAEPGSIRVWLLAEQNCLYRFESGVDSLIIVAVSNTDFIRSALLVAIYDGSNKFNVWDLQDGSCQTHSIGLIGKRVHKSRSVLLARNCRLNCFLYSFRDSNEAALHNASSGDVVLYLKCREKSSTVVGVAIAPDYLVLACRQLYLKSQEIHQLELFDPNNGFYLRKIRGCVHDVISCSLVVLSAGSSILTLNTSQQSNVTSIIVWNLETEGHKHLVKHPGISNILACNHTKRVLTASTVDNCIKQWDLSVKINQPAPEIKYVSNISQIKLIDNTLNCFVTFTANNGPVGLWMFDDILRNIHTTAEDVLDPSDIVLLNEKKLVILSERSFPSLTDNENQVFQSILIYNMETNRYDNKLSDCYINIFPRHDYAILPCNRLMGLSTSRSHFIIWSLTNGQVIQRIKPCFKDLNSAQGVRSRNTSKYLQARRSPISVTPWKQRLETESARKQRHELEQENAIREYEKLKREKENPIDGFLLSENRNILLVSYFAHHLCVFEIGTQQHMTTIEDENAMLLLNVAALTTDGSNFVHATYDEKDKTGYVTLRDSRSGHIKRRLKNAKDVCTIAITDCADRIVMVKQTHELHIWDPTVSKSLRKCKLHKSMKLDFDTRLFLMDNGQRGILIAGQISLWDLDHGELLTTFTPDSKILCCNVFSQGNIIVLGLPEESKPLVLSIENARINPRIHNPYTVSH